MYKVGDKIKFKSEKQRYTVRACDTRYLICTKPFNLRHNYLYTIVDLKEQVRGPDNYIFCRWDYEDAEDLVEAMKGLNSGELSVSFRHRIDLDLE